jgi:hypothetical protein
MKNETPARVLVVGRSPGVLVAAVELLRGRGHRADATNQFDQVLDDYAAVTAGAQVRVLTVGPLPAAVLRMVPQSAADQRLPAVAAVTTHGDGT